MSDNDRAKLLETLTWFYEKEQSVKNGPLSTALDAGFHLQHMGGGSLAFWKDYDDVFEVYYLITTEDGDGVDAKPEDPVWIVGLYAYYPGGTSWTLVSEPVTLPEVLERYSAIPMPEFSEDAAEREKIIYKWEDCLPKSSTPTT